MAHLILPSRRIVQPSGPVEIDRRFGNPSVWVPSCGLADLAGYSPWVATTFARNGVGRNGKTFSRGGADYNTAYTWSPRHDYQWESWLLWFDVWPVASYAIYDASTNTRLDGGSGALRVVAQTAITPTYGTDSGSIIYLKIRSLDERLVVKKSSGVITDQTASYGGSAALVSTGRYSLAALNMAIRWTNEEPSDEQLYGLLSNPYQIFKPVQRRIWFDMGAGGGAGIALDGAALVVASASGDLTTAINLAGSSASVSSASGALTAQITLAGSALAQAMSSALLDSGIVMTADAVAQAAAQGTLDTAIQMLGGAQAQAGGSGDLTTASGGLEGNAQASASAAASLTTEIRLSGAALASATASASLAGSAIALAGAAVSAALASGELTVTVALTAQALATAIAQGSLTTQIVLDADAAAQAQAGADLSGGSALVTGRADILLAGRRDCVLYARQRKCILRARAQ